MSKADLGERVMKFYPRFKEYLAYYAGIAKVWVDENGILFTKMSNGDIDNCGYVSEYYYAKNNGYEGSLEDWAALVHEGILTNRLSYDSVNQLLTNTIDGHVYEIANVAPVEDPHLTGNATVDNSKILTEASLGVPNGIAELDNAGKVPASQLPSYVDDVEEYQDLAHFPQTGETGKIYVALDTNKTYRWSGSTYIEISNATDVLDDSSSTGVTNKTWSTNKIITTLQNYNEDGVKAEYYNGNFYAIRYAECSTNARTSAKIAYITNGTFVLTKGSKVTVKFANQNTADNPTLNISTTGARSIKYKNNIIVSESGSPDAPPFLLSGVCEFVFDGTYWNLINGFGSMSNERSGFAVASCVISDSSNTLTATTADGLYRQNDDGYVFVKFSASSLSPEMLPANATLSIDGSTAANIIYEGAQIDNNTIKSNSEALFVFDGTNYNLISTSSWGKSLEQRVADLEYVPIEISAFSVASNLAELGSTRTSASLSYTLNKDASQIKLDNNVISNTSATGTISLESLSLTSNKTWTLKATDERNREVTKNTTLTFTNKVKYGASTIPTTVNDAFLNGLPTRTLSTGKIKTINVTTGANQYIWYALPSSYGTCTFTVGGFTGGFSLVSTFNHTNESGYTTEYRVYRSDNPNLGAQTVTIT